MKSSCYEFFKFILLLCTLFLRDDVISEQTILISGPSFFEKTVFSLIYFNLEHQFLTLILNTNKTLSNYLNYYLLCFL